MENLEKLIISENVKDKEIAIEILKTKGFKFTYDFFKKVSNSTSTLSSSRGIETFQIHYTYCSEVSNIEHRAIKINRATDIVIFSDCIYLIVTKKLV